MSINYIGHSMLHTPKHTLSLNNILHVPSSSRNLLLVHKFTSDNDIFFEFHPQYFLIKNRVMKELLLQGACVHGLYPLASSHQLVSQSAFLATSSPKQWHLRLVHPSTTIVQQVLRDNHLYFVENFKKQTVCDACQQRKSHQLSY